MEKSVSAMMEMIRKNPVNMKFVEEEIVNNILTFPSCKYKFLFYFYKQANISKSEYVIN